MKQNKTTYNQNVSQTLAVPKNKKTKNKKQKLLGPKQRQ